MDEPRNPNDQNLKPPPAGELAPAEILEAVKVIPEDDA